MSLQTQRLEKVEELLTPRQIFLHWLGDAVAFPSLNAYAKSLKGQPDSAYPMVRMQLQVRKAVPAAMKGERRDVVNEAVRRAERDVTFLFRLWWHLNEEVLNTARADAYGFLWLLKCYREFWHLSLKELPEPMATWRVHALTLAGEAHGLAGVIERVRHQYFGDAPALFPKEAEDVARRVDQWDKLLAMYTDQVLLLPVKRRAELQLTPEFAREAGEKLAELDTKHVIDLAKADTLRMMGEEDAAYKLMEPYV